MNNTQEKILSILSGVCGETLGEDELNLDLFENDLLDSLGLVELLVELESQFDVKLSPSEVSRSQIATPRLIADLVESRMAQ